ncbi:MAG: TRAM domain-containing protein [Candidatus Omnitrophica bacterium]|nr:TRAM domain-containing protein [Candidatus Omnitrophota bacterium]
MNSLNVIRALFVLIFAGAGYLLGKDQAFMFAMVGLYVGLIVVIIEAVAHRLSFKGFLAAMLGAVIGLGVGGAFGGILELFRLPVEFIRLSKLMLSLGFIYFGVALALKINDEFYLMIPYVRFKRQELNEESIVIDTSSIIDGRILDIVKTGFIDANLIVPRFVLNELQTLADSTEHIKRQRGKRGIEILHSLKKEPGMQVIIGDKDFKDKKGVDAKIVKLAKLSEAKVLTTDYNLNRIAQLEGVKVLNVNDLTNALKPICMPGEKLNLKLVKEGKESNQAVGYLEDGTMVVVENARWLIGKTAEVEVTSVLQSPSGRIVFTKLTG